MVIPSMAAYAATLYLTALPLAIWCVQSSLEVLAVRRAFWPGRALGPDLALLSVDRVRRAILASSLCSPAALVILPVLRGAAGIALPFVADDDAVLIAMLLVIIVTTMLLSVAMRGSDGAGKIVLVVCTAAATITAGRLTGDRWLCLAGLVWAAGQATIVYVTAGGAKIVRPFWRDGTALAATMSGYQSGHALAAAVVRHRGAALVLSWAVMLAELLFPLALVAPPALSLAILAVLAAFHVATAIIMGLNTYPWAFVATYPCVMLANAAITGVRWPMP